MKENEYRDIYCGEVNTDFVGKEIKLAGWINSIRNLGNLMFITLRDETGIVQLITSEPDKYNLTRESAVTIKGVVRKRADNDINKDMKTGEIEVELKSLKIVGPAESVLPFEINDPSKTTEETRLKYRYLDLRNQKMHENILFRSKVIDFLRNEMKSLGFTELQTPIITATSPEGARDFVVPARKYPGKFYALPQAPQIFKQLLMIGGFNKYFQIAPCFRDEDPRSDRLYGEFYQLDFEMSFATEEDVYKIGEKVLYDVFSNFSDKKVSPYPFRRISYDESMLKYGTDKPDLRNPLEIEDITDILSKSSLDAFRDTKIRTIKVENLDKPNSWFKKMEEYIKEKGYTLSYIRIKENKTFKSSLDKFLNDEIREELIKRFNLNEGDVLFIIADKKPEKILGDLRIKLGKELDLINNDEFILCIINDFPFYEENEEDGSIDFSHNPFSMPQGGLKALEEEDPFKIKAYQYDFVCNGYELASGGVRNHSREILKKAFELAGYDEQTVTNKFPALYEAFKYGAPPHAGMAPGIDRILMLLLDEENIREVVPFPLSSNGQDQMMNAPCKLFDYQIEELKLMVNEDKNS